LAQFHGVEEAFILSTCNRVELLVSYLPSSPAPELHHFIADCFQINPAALSQHLYEFSGQDVIRHLFRVAASLDSMVVGEPQILGQVKEAYATARSVGAVHSQM